MVPEVKIAITAGFQHVQHISFAALWAGSGFSLPQTINVYEKKPVNLEGYVLAFLALNIQRNENEPPPEI